MKIFGNQKTNLVLSDKAARMYSECDPLTLIEHEDGSYSLRGIEDRDGMTAEEVNRWLEDLADEMGEEKEMRIYKEQYPDLEKAALSAEATQEDINRLGKWFELYGESYWNGEFYDVDGVHRLIPVDREDEDGDFHREGYELR